MDIQMKSMLHVAGNPLIEEVRNRIGEDKFNKGWVKFCEDYPCCCDTLFATSYYVMSEEACNRHLNPPPSYLIDLTISQILRELGVVAGSEVYIDFLPYYI